MRDGRASACGLVDPVSILVVDDEPAVRDALARTLRFEGYDVEIAEDGDDALELVAGSRTTRSCSTS